MRLVRDSLLIKLVLLAASLLTVIFAATGFLLERRVSVRAARTVEEEVQASFQAYESLWQERTLRLQQISKVISRMPDVRAAFMTADTATIQDTANELQTYISSEHALFAVTDGTGKVIAFSGQSGLFEPNQNLAFIKRVAPRFPNQSSGLWEKYGRLFQVIVTPVYVEGGNGQNLMTTLVTGFELDGNFLASLNRASGGSDFVFRFKDKVITSTLMDKTLLANFEECCAAVSLAGKPLRVNSGTSEYLAIGRILPGIDPRDAGALRIFRSIAAAQRGLKELTRTVLFMWVSALLAAIGCAYLLVRKILRPVAELDRAAVQIAAGNYGIQVPAEGNDEMGRLTRSFNAMSTSLENARAELIRHERLSAVARLAASVVHDLRNPLASIYAGAEMLVDGDLPSAQVKRLARNMYQASRGMLDILQELLSTARKEAGHKEISSVQDLVSVATSSLSPQLESRRIVLESEIPPELEVKVECPAMERVFLNLFENAIEAIGLDGKITVTGEVSGDTIIVQVTDTGRGIPPELQSRLFQPFVSEGKQNGLGLGLVLSRQTVRSEGGDLWIDAKYKAGARFCLSLPVPHECETAAPEDSVKDSTSVVQ
jgi:signal transduction histidine kinase